MAELEAEDEEEDKDDDVDERERQETPLEDEDKDEGTARRYTTRLSEARRRLGAAGIVSLQILDLWLVM